MNPEKKGLAIFDFDGTIICKDSFIEFIRFTHGSVRLYACYFYNIFYVLFYFLKLYPNNKLKERFFGFFYKGFNEEQLKQLGVVFSQKKINGFYHKNSEEILNWHKKLNHDILILTASSSIWMGEWCNRNGFKLIDTRFEVINGVYTGKIEGKNCYGKEKQKRIETLIPQYDYNQTFGYGDTKPDLYFLSLTHKSYYGSLKNNKNKMDRKK